jgi:predicted transcriptional regulator
MSKIVSRGVVNLGPADRLHRELATAVVTFHEAVAAQLGVTAADQRVLGVLGQMGIATPGQLAETTGLTTGAITGIVDRLERAGFVRREPNPKDRRSIFVHACNAERLGKVMGPIFGSLTEEMEKLRSRYPAEKLDTIHAYLGEVIEILRAQTRQITTATKRR